MKCRNCPYGIDDYTSRIEMYKTVYGEYPGEERANESEQFVWCDKVGGKVYTYGHCSEFNENENKNKNHTYHIKKRKRNKRERYIKHKKHLKRLYNKAGNCYPTPIIYENKTVTNDVEHIKLKQYYKRVYRGKASKYLKRQSHKKIRKAKNELYNGNMSHKLYDFWWNYC